MVVIDVCGEVRMVVKEKGYMDELGSKLAQLPLLGNGARKLVGYFKRTQKNPQAYGYRCSFHPGVFQGINFPWVMRSVLVKI